MTSRIAYLPKANAYILSCNCEPMSVRGHILWPSCGDLVMNLLDIGLDVDADGTVKAPPVTATPEDQEWVNRSMTSERTHA